MPPLKCGLPQYKIIRVKHQRHVLGFLLHNKKHTTSYGNLITVIKKTTLLHKCICVSCLNWELNLLPNNKLVKQNNIISFPSYRNMIWTSLKHALNTGWPVSYMITLSVSTIVTIEASHTSCEVVSISLYMSPDESALNAHNYHLTDKKFIT